jgi:hypothetical protein
MTRAEETFNIQHSTFNVERWKLNVESSFSLGVQGFNSDEQAGESSP